MNEKQTRFHVVFVLFIVNDYFEPLHVIPFSPERPLRRTRFTDPEDTSRADTGSLHGAGKWTLLHRLSKKSREIISPGKRPVIIELEMA
jgi:hypothetical protein